MQNQTIEFTLEEFEKKFFPQYYEERQREKDYDEAEKISSKEISVRVEYCSK